MHLLRRPQNNNMFMGWLQMFALDFNHIKHLITQHNMAF